MRIPRNLWAVLLCGALGLPNEGRAAIAFVQSGLANPQSSVSTVQVGLGAQTAGNLNVVVIGWNNNTVNVTSISDSKGNFYAVAPGSGNQEFAVILESGWIH